MRQVTKGNRSNRSLDTTGFFSTNLKKKNKALKKYKNLALKNKDEWLDYMVKNLKTINEEFADSRWPKHLLKYINNEK